MGYSTEVVRRAMARLASAKADRESVYNARLEAAYGKLPRLQELDEEIAGNMAQAALAAFHSGKVAGAMDSVREENARLQQERQALLEANFEPGYLDNEPLCPHCSGYGFVGSAMCGCLEELCRQEQAKEVSVLGGNASFETFRLDYYPEQVDRNLGVSPRAVMARNFEICRRFVDTFGGEARNLLFVGSTGLGKTFLSAAIAAEVVKKGNGVAYESATHLFNKLEKNRFKPTEETAREAERLENCDLLIIDDLGTELPGQFVTAALYALVNDRLIAKKSTIISTNLTVDEIAVRYSPQIASRLRGEYVGLTFLGEDIRLIRRES